MIPIRPSDSTPDKPAPPTKPTKPLSERTTWHLWANTPMVLWLLALLVVAVAHRWIATSGWLLVHLLLLGAITNAIVVWSQHFTDALLRRRIEPGSRRWQIVRLITLNLGVLTVVSGMIVAHWLTTLARSAHRPVGLQARALFSLAAISPSWLLRVVNGRISKG